MVPDTLPESRWWSEGAMYQFSGVQYVRKPIRKTLSHHLQVGSLEDCWFLTHILEVGNGL